MYLVIEKDYTVAKSRILTGHLRMRARMGEISLIDCSRMMGLNRATFPYSDHGDWSEINEYVKPDLTYEKLEDMPQ